MIGRARITAQRYFYTYQEPIPVEQLVQRLCDLKQGYTQFGGLRPFGVSFLFAGWDRHYGTFLELLCNIVLTMLGFQLYQSDPSGNYGGWKATAIGANSTAAQSILKTDYQDDISLKDALKLTVKVRCCLCILFTFYATFL